MCATCAHSDCTNTTCTCIVCAFVARIVVVCHPSLASSMVMTNTSSTTNPHARLSLPTSSVYDHHYCHQDDYDKDDEEDMDPADLMDHAIS